MMRIIRAAKASINHVEDNIFMDEHKVTFNLVVEFVRYLYTANIVWARLGPFSTNTASLHNIGKHIKDPICNTNPIQEATHDMLRGMPPSNMELPKCKTNGSIPVGSK